MQAEGVTLLEEASRLAVMGFVEVLRKIPQHFSLLRQLERRLASGRVALVVLIDYPGFNMKVGAAARRHGVPVLYYITPQVWAWGAGRLPQLARIISKAAVILPFEEALLRGAGIDATFVGHPLLDRAQALPARESARQALGVGPNDPLLVIFPGSREQEVRRHLTPFVATARLLEQQVPGLRVLVAAAPTVRLNATEIPYPVVAGASLELLRAADAALCKSGTTTLEAAVTGCPLIVAYRTSAWTYAMARRLVKIPRIGLVNVVAGREVAPEFVQDAAEPGRMAAALRPLLDGHSPDRETMLAGLAEVRAKLGTAGAALRTARLAAELIG
jgi:lipid-A-disaccharide synthase